MNTTDNVPAPETSAVSDAVPIQEELTPEQNAMLADAIARRLHKARRQKHNTKGAFGKSHFLNGRHIEYKGGMAKPAKAEDSTFPVSVSSPKVSYTAGDQSP